MKFQKQFSLHQNMTFLLQCNLISGTKPVFFEWHRNGLKLPHSEQYRIDHYESYSTLTLNNVQLNAIGNYSCSVKNSFGTDSIFTYLLVKGLEKIFH